VAGDDCYIMKVAGPDLEGAQATPFEKMGVTLPEVD
jgi:hypothetical protein